MKLVLAHATPRGTAYIAQSRDGRFHPMWDAQDLGSYATAAQAIEDFAGGHTYWPSDGTDPATLGLSDDPADWSPVRPSA